MERTGIVAILAYLIGAPGLFLLGMGALLRCMEGRSGDIATQRMMTAGLYLVGGSALALVVAWLLTAG
jgi:hypothetical protein